MTNLVSANPGRTASVAKSTVVTLVVMVGLVVTTSAAQNPERDSSAISTLQSAITALGGSNVIAGIQDCILTGSILNQNGTNTKFTWTTSGSEFRIETTARNGGTNVFVSGHGSPAWIMNGNTSALNYYMARANLPFYLPPYVLLQELQNPIYTLRYIGAVQVNGTSVIQIHISDDSDPVGTLVTPQEWYFDSVSFLPVRVQVREPANESAANYGTATYDMSQFVPVNGVMVPYKISYSNDTTNEVLSIGTVTFNSGVSQSIFDPPQRGTR
jgi:hypothetical protein